MKTQVIVLNGSSSSGKTTIARCLKAILPTPWISLSVDDLLRALPPSLMDSDAGIAFGEQGEITIGGGFRAVASPWLAGVAAMARAGARIIYDDVFLSGAESQERLRQHLGDLSVLWVGVHCDAGVAAGREIARGDRVVGGAATQSNRVHEGVFYDVEVDTTSTESMACAQAIAERVSQGPAEPIALECRVGMASTLQSPSYARHTGPVTGQLGDLESSIRSYLAEGEDLIVISKGRIRYSTTSAGTFYSIGLAVRGYDLLRRPFQTAKLRAKAQATGLPLARRMILAVTSQRLVVWSSDRRFRKLGEFLGSIPRDQLTEVVRPFVGGIDWKTVRMSTPSAKVQLQIDAKTVEQFASVLGAP